MIPSDMPQSARIIITRAALRYEIEPEGIFKPYGQRTPDERAARAKAILDVSNMEVDGRPRFSMARIGGWFNCTRNNIYQARKRSPDFAPRTAPARVEP